MGVINWQHELATVSGGEVSKKLLRHILTKLAEDSRGEDREAFLSATPEGFGKVIRKKIIEALKGARINLENIEFSPIEVYEDKMDVVELRRSEPSAIFPPDDPVYQVIVSIIKKERSLWDILNMGFSRRNSPPQYITIGVTERISM